MSSLTSKVKMCWRAVIYDKHNTRVHEGNEFYNKNFAISDAEDLVKMYVEKFNKYYYARIECVVVPLYE